MDADERRLTQIESAWIRRFPEVEAPLVEKGLGRVKHCIIRGSDRKVGIALCEQGAGSLDGALCFGDQLVRLGPHACMASSRALFRKGLSGVRHSDSLAKTRLMLTP